MSACIVSPTAGVFAALKHEGAAGPIRSEALAKVQLWEDRSAASEHYIVR